MIGRTPISTTPEPNWLVAATDEAAMKKAIAENLGATATPKQVGETYQRYAAQREIRQTMARIEQCGAKVGYFAADVTDSRQMADIFHQIHVRYGSITALVHGAGVLADKRIEDLTLEQFDRVYRTKVVGLQNILELLGGEELKAIMLFSSTTARFGRTGQVAYAVANEVLNKYAQVESRLRLATRVVAINWGPWDGGMVTPGLRKVFESEGVGLIPLADGGVFAIQELNMGGRAAEVVAMGKVRPAPKSDSTAAPGAAINRTAAPAFPASAPLVPPTNPPTSELNFVFERTVDLETHPVMRSHVIDGRAVLPMALHMEWLAHAALHGNPGLLFHGFNEMRVTNGVMIEEGHPSTVRAMAGRATKVDKMFHVPVELRGKRRDGRDVIHSKAEVILAATLPKAPFAQTAPELQPYPHPLDEIYRYFLFHGPDLHGIEKADGVSEVAFVGSVFPAPTPAEWFREPLRTAWVTDPLVLDASFQMMILWSYTQHGSGSLPCFAGRFRQYRRMFPNAPIRVVIRITRDNGSFARADIDYLDAADGTVIAQIQDYECVIDPQLNQAFRRNQLAQRQKLST
jgi:NAD(P)-dependent dehydrogenase (short-subunit alcohol dehydrogenase family)